MAFQQAVNQFQGGLISNREGFNRAIGNLQTQGEEFMKDQLGKHYESIANAGVIASSTVGLIHGTYKGKGAIEKAYQNYRQKKLARSNPQAQTDENGLPNLDQSQELQTVGKAPDPAPETAPKTEETQLAPNEDFDTSEFGKNIGRDTDISNVAQRDVSDVSDSLKLTGTEGSGFSLGGKTSFVDEAEANVSGRLSQQARTPLESRLAEQGLEGENITQGDVSNVASRGLGQILPLNPEPLGSGDLSQFRSAPIQQSQLIPDTDEGQNLGKAITQAQETGEFPQGSTARLTTSLDDAFPSVPTPAVPVNQSHTAPTNQPEPTQPKSQSQPSQGDTEVRTAEQQADDEEIIARNQQNSLVQNIQAKIQGQGQGQATQPRPQGQQAETSQPRPTQTNPLEEGGESDFDNLLKFRSQQPQGSNQLQDRLNALRSGGEEGDAGVDGLVQGGKDLATSIGKKVGTSLIGEGLGDGLALAGSVVAEAIPVVGEIAGLGSLIYGLVKGNENEKKPLQSFSQGKTQQATASGFDPSALFKSAQQNVGATGSIV